MNTTVLMLIKNYLVSINISTIQTILTNHLH